MAKKKSKNKKNEIQTVNSVVRTARHIWLAGLGAFIAAEEEGSKLFEILVKHGEEVEGHTKKIAEGKVDAMKDKVESAVEEMRDKTTDTWEGLEQVFEDRVARVLNRLGVPTQEDVEELDKHIQNLTKNIKNLTDTNPNEYGST
jgi:poly(hydroxyalkanoate) granule-associated protein